jgi:uncharacterized GH25 family protein
MNRIAKLAVAAALATAILPAAAQAHRQWILPSATVLSGSGQWVTFDAAVSNDVFYLEHNPLRLGNLGIAQQPMPGMPMMPGATLRVSAPDGSEVKAENAATGRFRTVFDVHLTQNGTYKVAALNEALFASYKEGGQTKRWRGTAENLAKEVPANAEGLQITQAQGRVEVFVTSGKPTDGVLKPTGTGLELVPVTHPNNLVVGEKATFKLMLDGKPASDLDIAIVPGGIRYRDKLDEIAIKTGVDGSFSVTWPGPGMYWLGASVQDDKTTVKGAKRRAGYVATLEVLPQ